MKWSTSPHRPPHLYVDDAWYFITAATVDKSHILSTEGHFDLWVRAFKELITEFNARLAAWVILANHYHFLFLPQHGLDLGKFMKRLNGRTSRELNLLDNTVGRSVWYSYWDSYIRGSAIFGRGSITFITTPSSMGMLNERQIGNFRVILGMRRATPIGCWNVFKSSRF